MGKLFAGFFAFVAATLSSHYLSQLKIQGTQNAKKASKSEERRKMDPILFKTLTFGQLPAALDWWFLISLQDSDVVKVAPGTHPELYYGLELVSDLDPLYFEVYQAGANLLSVVRGDGTGARDLLIKGDAFVKNGLQNHSTKFIEQYWPNAWNISMLLGYVYLFQLDDLPHAAEAFRHSSQLPNAPPYLAQLHQRLSKFGGPYEAGLRLIDFMISGASDERVRDRLSKRKSNLSVNYEIFKLNHLFKEFRTRRSTTHEALEDSWKEFLAKSKMTSQDPWGGEYSIDPNGKVATTTPHETVFGLNGE